MSLPTSSKYTVTCATHDDDDVPTNQPTNQLTTDKERSRRDYLNVGADRERGRGSNRDDPDASDLERETWCQVCKMCNHLANTQCVIVITQCVFVKTHCVIKSVFIFPINLRTA